MKKFAIALATTALTTSAVFADANNFNGPSIGAQFGLAQSDGSFRSGENFTPNAAGVAAGLTATNAFHKADLSTKGVIGGIHLGWDKVFQNKWLLGIEIYGDLSSLEGKVSRQSTDRTVSADTWKTSMEYSIGVNVRGGVIVSDTLAYLSLGWVGSEWEIKQTSGHPLEGGLTGKKSDFESGFRVGLGMATMVNNNLMLSLEGGYTWYGDLKVNKSITSVNINGVNTPINGTAKVDSKYSPEVLEAKLKLSWKIRGLN